MAAPAVQIRVDSRYLPTMLFDAVGGASAPPPLAARILRPQVTVLVGGQPLYTVAPAGEPGPSRWPKVRTGLLIAGLAVVGLVVVKVVL
jgi:hypothetical protein